MRTRINKLRTIEELQKVVEIQRTKGKRIIFANGCFDLLHVGHVRYLQEAKDLGDILIVAINSDSSTRRLKGKGRPVTREMERAEIIAALECVDYIIIFNDLSVSNLLLALKPDVQAKGTDYTIETVPELETVRSYMGEVAITGDPKDRSSTGIIEKIISYEHT